MVVAHSEPSVAKSALRMEGAIMAGGLMVDYIDCIHYEVGVVFRERDEGEQV